MSTELIINATLPETRIALLEEGEIQELHIERDSERGIVGNIYKGKVLRVLPGMQAAFVDIGLEKAAFLYVDDIFFPDMKTPLVSPPLPEPKQALPAAAKPGAGDTAPAPQSGGRGGRRLPRVEPRRTPLAKGHVPVPGSPEEHAQMQREYAKRMVDVEDELGATADPHAHPELGGGEVAPAQAGPGPQASALPEEQPQARLPEVVVEEEDGSETEPAVVYRAEPIMDAEAWAEELEGPEEAADQAVGTEPAVQPAPAVRVPETPGTAMAGEPAPGTEVTAETAPGATAITGEAAPAGPPVAPVATRPPVAPLVTPLPQPRPAHGRGGGRAAGKDEDEDDLTEMPRRRRHREPVNIADLVKEGQEILVQVAKDPIGTKGARLTCHVSLPGRYLVFMPTVDHIGVSRRIEAESARRRLKETIAAIRPARTGVIVRTASGRQTDKQLKADLDYLVTTWNEIQKKFNKQRTPSAVYQDLTIVLRAIRDMFTDEVDKVVVDSKREHRAILKFVTRFIPHVKDKVELYAGDMPIFDAFGIETEISRALERKVWLKSGGYLMVDQAEALVAIDVNTGRYVGKKTLEETILKTNLEAVREIAYQLRLRNCGGIIILDLIDMEKESNREKVYKALEEELKKDRARPSILKISQLGLVEMTRKRTRDSMVRALCESCSYCEGRGFVKNKLTIGYDIMRDIEREAMVRETQAISIQCHPTVADVLLEDKRDVIEDLEHQCGKKITIRGNGAYHVEQYELVAHREPKNVIWSSEERRQMLRQKIQERQQKIAAESRKIAEAERQERRRQEDALRAERRARPGAELGEEAAGEASLDEAGADSATQREGEARRRGRRGRRGRGRRGGHVRGPHARMMPPGGPTTTGPAPVESLEPSELAGTVMAEGSEAAGGGGNMAPEEEMGAGSAIAGGGPGMPGEPRKQGRRRRGRRGGRNRRRGRMGRPVGGAPAEAGAPPRVVPVQSSPGGLSTMPGAGGGGDTGKHGDGGGQGGEGHG